MKHGIIRNISFVFCANIVATIGSAILSILVPGALSVEAYGYWQLNVLYGGYVAILHCGWVDGVYIRYAGISYDKLDKKKQHSQFVALLIMQVIISIIGVGLCSYFIVDRNKAFAICAVFCGSAFSIPMGMLNFILQGCGRIKEYSISTILGRLLSLMLSVLMLCCGIGSYKGIIIAGNISTIVSFFYVVCKCKDIVFAGGENIKECLTEAFANIRCGIKVSIAFLTSNLIVGAIRYLIEDEWGIDTFGKVSLTISMTHLLLVFINAVGVVLLPIIRNVNVEEQKSVYVHMNRILTIFISICFIAYYPMARVLTFLLPEYAESIEMMALIFPICLFESKTGLLNNTYLKALRKENALLVINLISAITTVISGFLVVKVYGNFEFAILLIMIMLAFRTSLSDVYLSRNLNIHIRWDLLIGYLCSALFVIINYTIQNKWIDMGMYACLVITICFLQRKEIRNSCNWLLGKVKDK